MGASSLRPRLIRPIRQQAALAFGWVRCIAFPCHPTASVPSSSESDPRFDSHFRQLIQVVAALRGHYGGHPHEVPLPPLDSFDFCARIGLGLHRCATGPTAGLPETSAPQKHVRSPWRYRHMNHLHTRPWYKGEVPLFPPCSVCTATPKARPDTSKEDDAVLTPSRPETALPPGAQPSLDGSAAADGG